MQIIAIFLFCFSLPLQAQKLDLFIKDEANYFKRALTYFDQKDRSRSKQMLARLFVQRPTNQLYRFNLANSLYELGEYEKAIYHYKEILRQQNAALRVPCLLYLAASLKENGEMYKASKALIEFFRLKNIPVYLREQSYELAFALSLETRRKDKGQKMLSRGIRAYYESDFKKALQYYRASMQLHYDYDTLMLIAISQLKLGKKKMAKQSFQIITRDASSNELKTLAQEMITRL